MDAIDFLLAEHRKIRHKWNVVRETQDFDVLRRRWNQLVRMLKLHETMEQQAWYPYLPFDVSKFFREEQQAAAQLENLALTSFASVSWWTQFDQLHEDVLAHAANEEQHLFPLVRNALSRQESIRLKENMKRFKREGI